ncbi:hypothetical protein HPB48_026246 [Haemaphysalis longicornis]|uniref:ABC transmembrane type-1 domain-containing protein n=1 Tax=Haemaphysalis longicornis TaxID=44386 RepID=A0A9J6HBY7_HAELO|nr:hypothetical protein HPB48_026246 [Haemaphysalis longicornis]
MYASQQGRIVRYRDQRLGKMTDTLSCVRLVKFYALEEAVEEAVSRLREKEGFFLFLANLLDGFIDTLQMSSTSVMTIILLGTFAAVNQQVRLTAACSFSSLYMLSIMDAVFANTATLLRLHKYVSTFPAIFRSASDNLQFLAPSRATTCPGMSPKASITTASPLSSG